MPHPSNVNVYVLLTLLMEPGSELTYFEEYAPRGEVRWFIAEPQLIRDPALMNYFEDDKIVAVTDVYQLSKGWTHSFDGTGGTGGLQTYVTFHNRSASFEPTVVHVLEAATESN